MPAPVEGTDRLPADAQGQTFLGTWDGGGFRLLRGVLYRAATAAYGLLVKAAPPNGTVRASVVAVGTSPVALPGTALGNRERMTVFNAGSAVVYLGGAGVTASDGLPVLPGAAWVLETGPDAAWFAIAQTGTQAVRVLEQAG